MSVTSSLVGILLVGETQKSRSQVIGTIRLPPAAQVQTLKQLRVTLLPVLTPVVREKSYLFLTPKGWKISNSLEDSLQVTDILDQEMCMRIQLDYAKPRVGIVLEGECNRDGDVPLGFVFCELNASLCDLAARITLELISAYTDRSPKRFSFLDRNGWPIPSDQEGQFTVLDVIGDNAVRIRFGLHPGNLSLTTSSTPRLALPQTTRPSTPPRIVQLGASEGGVASAPAHVHKASEILISYVHSEATPHAIALKRALQDEGYSVFLDVDSIAGGSDWQDALNEAISLCSLFVPLVTPRYGYTLWTNREVKLADIVGKVIVPVNFLADWPPPCLAIQFSTTQYIQWEQPRDPTVPSSNGPGSDCVEVKSKELMSGSISSETVTSAARAIVQRYRKELVKVSLPTPTHGDEVDGNITDADTHSPPATTTTTTLVTTKPSVKSCPSLLPSTVSKDYQQIIQQPRSGVPLVVMACHPAQRELAGAVGKGLEGDMSEVWYTCDSSSSEETHAKINDAGVVVVMFSEEFVGCSKCQANVFYSEQRKRIIPILIGSILLPDWATMLVGTNVFVDSRSSGFVNAVLDKVRAALNPRALECELAMAAKHKEELDALRTNLAAELPRGKLVFISGGTKFFSPLGEAICIELGTQLAREKGVVLVTGGFYGVGDTVAKTFYNERIRLGEPHGVCHVVAVRDDQDKSLQTRQRPDGTFEAVPYGDTLFYGSSVRQRETLVPILLDLCVLVEGGPGAAFEVQQFNWNEKYVVPVAVTGGAASGLFEVPKSIFHRPEGVSQTDWSLLSDKRASPHEVAAAIVRIVRTLALPRSDRKALLKRADTEIVVEEEEDLVTTTANRTRSYSVPH